MNNSHRCHSPITHHRSSIHACLMALAVFCFSQDAFARPFRPGQMPNGNRFSCANCHLNPGGGGPRNAFGTAVETIIGGNSSPIPFWSPTLAAMDSDGDGFTNGQELGDPDGDGVAAAGAQVTNPGVASSKPANSAPSVQITRPASGTTFELSASIDIEASASDTDGTIAKVEFLSDGNLFATSSTSPYTATLSAATLAAGSHSLTARATDNAGASATSSAIEITITEPIANQPPNIQITRPGNGATFDTAALIEIEATASDPDGTVVSVEFVSGRSVLFSSSAAPHVYRVSGADLGVGTRTLTARATDNLGATVSSAELQINIIQMAPPSITVASAADGHLRVTWTGGPGPFILQQRAAVADGAWVNAPAVTTNETLVPLSAESGFFRIADLGSHDSIPFTVAMSGAAERPQPVNTTATGFGILRLDGNALIFNIQYSGLSGPASAAHIHGPATAATPAGVLISLEPFNGGAFGAAGTLSGSVQLTSEQKALVLSGQTYVNIHTAANGGGEIRGQIAPVAMQASLAGRNERPDPITTTATGTGSFVLSGDQLTFNVVYTGLSGPAVGAHIHGPATADQSAGVMINLQEFNGGAFGASGRLAGTVTLTPDQLAAVVDGLTYVNIHTGANQGGEIRGQIRPQVTAIPLSTLLSGAAERPDPVNTTASGSGLLLLEGNILSFQIQYSGLSGPAAGAHIHGPASSAEATGVLINLAPFNGGAFGASGTLSGSVALTAEQRAFVLDGRTYVNVHTDANGGGEIRGQLTPVLKTVTLNGANERPDPVTTSGAGSGSILQVGDQLTFSIHYVGLSGPASAAHIHGPATAEQSAGVLIGLNSFNGGAFDVAGDLFGALKLTADQLPLVIDRLSYVNIHTAANGGGEIRGQIE